MASAEHNQTVSGNMTKPPPPKFDVDIGFDSRGKKLEGSVLLAELAKNSKGGAKLRKSLLYALKDFGPYEGKFLINRSCRVEGLKLPSPEMVFVALVHVSGNSYAGRFEKVAWSVAFTYKKIPYAFSLEKFGLRLYHHKHFASSAELSREMLSRLTKALPIIDRLFAPFVLAQVAAGNVTLANAFIELDNMYFYFRKRAEKAFSFDPNNTEGAKDMSHVFNEWFRSRSEGTYNATAMIDAFFSRLEHLLIILLPFATYDRKANDLVKLMGARWGEKFKTIFNVTADREAKKLYDQLVELRERYRNPVSHGNFQKDGKSLFFHLSPVGAVSCHLSSGGGERAASVLKIDRVAFQGICAAFDRLDKFLNDGALRHGFRYAKSGLDVAFDEASLARYREAAKDDESIEALIDRQNHIRDMHANMDW